jgi:dienelactone hydrolase
VLSRFLPRALAPARRPTLHTPIAMRSRVLGLIMLCVAGGGAAPAHAGAAPPEIVRFGQTSKPLAGELFKPAGPGPFPAVLYNHGSAPGMLNGEASRALAPLFVRAGWVFFMPYRRGQGLSAQAGPYILDEIAAARRRGGKHEASVELVRLLATDHLQDQMQALAWLRSQPYVRGDRVALAGNSFGGIEAILGAAQAPTCATVAASAASDSWDAAPELQQLMKEAAGRSAAPLLLFQAANDFNLAPNKTLLQIRQQAGKPVEYKLYPPFGALEKDGHSFAYRGADIWFADIIGFLVRNCGK